MWTNIELATRIFHMGHKYELFCEGECIDNNGEYVPMSVNNYGNRLSASPQMRWQTMSLQGIFSPCQMIMFSDEAHFLPPMFFFLNVLLQQEMLQMEFSSWKYTFKAEARYNVECILLSHKKLLSTYCFLIFCYFNVRVLWILKMKDWFSSIFCQHEWFLLSVYFSNVFMIIIQKPTISLYEKFHQQFKLDKGIYIVKIYIWVKPQ